MKLLREFSRLKWLQTSQWIDRFADNFCRRSDRYGFDFNSALRTCHDQRRSRGAIEQNGKINFPRDLRRLRHQYLVDDAPGCAGLMCDEGLSKHFLRDLARFFRRFANVNAAFKPACESSLPSPTGVDLRFHYDFGRGDFTCDLLCLLGR